MKRYKLNLLLLTAIGAVALGPVCYGDHVQWFNNAMEDEWWDTVGDVTTIDFTDYPHGTIICDQYADMGVNFEGQNNVILEIPSFINDGFGLRGWMGTWVHFDEPMNWISADFPGGLAIALYLDGELIYESFEFGFSGTGNFGGLISEKPFNTAYFFRIFGDNVAYIDDLHFGALTVPAPPALGLVALALLANRRRRRE